MKIGVTERGDAAVNHEWKPWVESGKPAILITKNPVKLFNHINKDMNIIVNCTITGYGHTSIEPNVPYPCDSINAMYLIGNKIGADKVVLRIDPIIPTPKGIEKSMEVFSKNAGYRVRISFLDNYDHIKTRFRNAGLPVLSYDFHAPLDIRKKVWEDMGRPEVCAEPGLPCSGCVSKTDADILGVSIRDVRKGQRPLCNCVVEKHELLSNKHPCTHNCLYCYWLTNNNH